MPETGHEDDRAASDATVIVVSYRCATIDLAWVPEDAPVIVVHNDHSLDPKAVAHPTTTHLGTRTNIGFGRAVNLALPHVSSPRVVLANPDTTLSPAHWEALSSGGPHELVVIPLVDPNGVFTSCVNRYPTPSSLVLTALRAGRLFSRDSAIRKALLPLLGAWGRQHNMSLTPTPDHASWSADTHWPCAAACSYPTELLRRVGGFDPEYFLYLEDIDVARRMADSDSNLVVVQRNVAPGVHQVASSSHGRRGRRLADLEQALSAARYAKSNPGLTWRLAGVATGLLARWRARGVHR